MSNITEYLQMKEEADKAITVEQIQGFINKHKCMPVGMIKELQTKLNVINEDNKNNGIGIFHIIS